MQNLIMNIKGAVLETEMQLISEGSYFLKMDWNFKWF